MLIVTFLSLLVFPFLYIFRSYDGNTLVSWKWTFHDVHLGTLYMIIIAACAMSFILSKININKKYYSFLLLTFSFSCVVPLWNLPETIIDSSRYIIQSQDFGREGIGYFLREWGGQIQAWTDLPVVPFLYGLIFRLFGESRLYLQILNGMLFSLSVLFTYLLGRELWDEEKGLYAGLFLLAIPYLVIQPAFIMIDTGAMFFMTAALYFYVKALRKGGTLRLGLSSMVIVLAMLTKYSMWLMLPVLPLSGFASVDYSHKSARKRTLLILAAAGILFSIIIAVHSGLFVRQIDLLLSYQAPALKKWGDGYLSIFFFQSHPFLIVLSAVGIYTAFRKRDRTFLVPAWFFIFIIMLQVERARYSVPLLPLFALSASYGLNFIRFQNARRYAALCIVGLSMVVVYSGYYPFLKETSMVNLQNAGRYINEKKYHSVDVITLPQSLSSGNTDMAVPLLDLYTSANIFHEKRKIPSYRGGSIGGLPLQFTWDYALPPRYDNVRNDDPDAIIVISAERLNRDALRNVLSLGNKQIGSIKSFESLSGAFRYRSLVYVIGRKSLSD